MAVVRIDDDDAFPSVHYLFIELFTFNYSLNFTHTRTPWFKMMRKFETFKKFILLRVAED